MRIIGYRETHPNKVSEVTMRSVEWHDGKVRMIDQRLLPAEFHLVEYHDHRQVAQAIRTMVIRGAPAIG
ncbi:MAG: hypothetical protein DRI48_01855, partial [Chloroflexi bacterium]